VLANDGRGEVARSQFPEVAGLDAGATHQTEWLNFMPVDGGTHSMTINLLQDGNVIDSETHWFEVQE
jgi:hypothetical protein